MKYSIIFLALALKILVLLYCRLTNRNARIPLFRGLEYTSMSDPAIYH